MTPLPKEGNNQKERGAKGGPAHSVTFVEPKGLVSKTPTKDFVKEPEKSEDPGQAVENRGKVNDSSKSKEKVVDDMDPKLGKEDIDNVQLAYKCWLEECCSSFREERNDRETIFGIIPWESTESYVMKLSVWMRETGGPMQTEHPVWNAIQKFAKEVENIYQEQPDYEKNMREWVRAKGCPDDVSIDEIERALWDEGEGKKEDSGNDWMSKLEEPETKNEALSRWYEENIGKLKKCYERVQRRSKKLYCMILTLHSEEIRTSLDGRHRKFGT